jgi:hypothetical protein
MEPNDTNWRAVYDAWKTNTPPMESVQTPEQEYIRERLFWEFEAACAELAKVEGWPAVIRAVGHAMKDADRG